MDTSEQLFKEIEGATPTFINLVSHFRSFRFDGMASEALCRGGKSDICVGLVGKLAEVAEQTKMFE